MVSTSIEKVLDLNRETLVLPGQNQKRLTFVAGQSAKNTEKREQLKAELCEARLKFKMVEYWNEMVTNANQNADATLLPVAEVKKNEYGKSGTKRGCR